MGPTGQDGVALGATTQGAPTQDGIVPDTKDWTWTLERPCPDCGFDAASLVPESVADLTIELTVPWREVLAREGVATRPSPGVWSPLEYACHVRDVCRVFDGRVRLMLEQDEPTFPDWDQDATAVQEGYGAQVPSVVAHGLAAAASSVSARFAAVSAAQWSRPGRRSNGSEFTVESLGRYFLHDLAHHLVDVGAGSARGIPATGSDPARGEGRPVADAR